MNAILKNSIAITLAGALVAAAATPSFAQRGRTAAAAGIGFAAGALLGAAAANAGGYYYAPGYSYGPAYPSESYYAPAPVAPAYGYYGYAGECRTDEGYGRTSACDTR